MEQRERCALLRQNPDYRFDGDAATGESVMSRTINNIGLVSEECHVPVVDVDSVCVASQGLANELETVLQCSDQTTADTGASSQPDHDHFVADIDTAAGCLYTKHLAQLAAAKSQQMVTLSEDTFGDDESSTDSEL